MNDNVSDIHFNKFLVCELKDMIAHYVGPQRVPGKLRVITDTSDFFRVDYDDVVILDGRPYFIRNYEREGRFTIDEQPKFWVRKAIDLTDGGMKIIKMVFHEKFDARVGDLIFECVRSPRKEARILDITRGHPNFMQGFSTRDSAGNIIRIIDFISGKTMADHVSMLGNSHEDYYYNYFPSVLESFIELTEAIGVLHEHGEKHGDIRRDHIIRDSRENIYRWIDFDFNYWHKENMFGYDIFGLGNILAFLVARGEITAHYLKQHSPDLLERLTNDDMNIIFNNRVVNLQKIYPYIPDTLNFILLHFSMSADVFYDDTKQFLDELHEAGDKLAYS